MKVRSWTVRCFARQRHHWIGQDVYSKSAKVHRWTIQSLPEHRTHHHPQEVQSEIEKFIIYLNLVISKNSELHDFFLTSKNREIHCFNLF